MRPSSIEGRAASAAAAATTLTRLARRSSTQAILALSLCASMACVGGIDDPARFLAAMGDAAAPPPRLACVDAVPAMFASSCAGAACHSAGGPSVDLLSPDVAARVVGVAARSGGGVLADVQRPTESVLLRRLLGTSAGPVMPPGAPQVSAEVARCVEAWIGDQKAPGALSPEPPPAVVPTTPGAADAGVDVAAPPVTGTTVRVAAGSDAPYTDPGGRVWSADVGSSGGMTVKFDPPPTILGTTTPALYQAERYGPGAAFRYSFDAKKGKYKVTLKFSENYYTGPGQRTFDVDVAGQRALSAFDIFQAAGGKDKAVDRDVTITLAADGPLELVFSPVVENPKVSAIEIVPAP